MIGQRFRDGMDWSSELPAGAYWRDARGVWTALTPSGLLAGLAKHTVIEHDDGTITVSPSILVHAIEPYVYTAEERADLVARCGEDDVRAWERGRPEYHGFLERGMWRSC